MKARELIKGLLLSFDIDISRHSHSFQKRRLKILKRVGVNVVIDVGANVGQYASELRGAGYSGEIVSVEPQAEAYGRLLQVAGADGKWSCINAALGSRPGQVTLCVSGNSVSSSVLPMTDAHVRAAPSSRVVGREEAQMLTLDEIAQPYSQDVLGVKLDVQGYEDEVLRGGPLTLARASYLECELSLVELYSGQQLLPDMLQTLSNGGFRLAAVEPGFWDQETGETLQVNGVFLRDS